MNLDALSAPTTGLLDTPAGIKIADTIKATGNVYMAILGGSVNDRESAIQWASALASLYRENDSKQDFDLTRYASTFAKFGVYIQAPDRFVVGLNTISAEKLHKLDPKPPEFIVPSLLPIGLTIFAAAPKIGKSFACLDLSLAVTQGKTFWGLPTKQAHVLYFDFEGSGALVNDRMKKLGEYFPAGLNFAFDNDGKTINTGFLDQLNFELDRDPELKLVIVDTLQYIKDRARRGENAYEADVAVLRGLKKLAIDRQIAIICVSHLNKKCSVWDDSMGDPFAALQGSAGVIGTSDSNWVMYKIKNSKTGGRFFAQGKQLSSEIDYTMQFDSSVFRWQLQGDTAALDEERARQAYLTAPLRKAVFDLLGKETHVFVTKDDLFDAAATCGKQYADKRELKRALFKEFVDRFRDIDGITFFESSTSRAGKSERMIRIDHNPDSLI